MAIYENETRNNTRAKAYNINKPRICTNKFAYSVIYDWNTLPINIKLIKSENKFKECINKYLLAYAKIDELNQYVYQMKQ